MRGDLIRALNELHKKVRRALFGFAARLLSTSAPPAKIFADSCALLLSLQGPFDAVLLETTGMADPAPVAFSFYKSAIVKYNFKLDAILCLVDAKHIMQVR